MENWLHNVSVDTSLLQNRDLFLILSDDLNFEGRKSLQSIRSYDDYGLQEGGLEFPVALNEDSKTVEVLISKQSLMHVFVSSTKFVKSNFLENQDEVVVANTSGVLACNQWLATMGLLLATPENQTNVLMYQESIKNLEEFIPKSAFSEFQQRQFTYIRSLLTSNLAKTNKSSTLWTLFRGLTLGAAENNSSGEQLWDACVTTVLDSVTYHPRNYYAWNYFRWLISYIYKSSDQRGICFIKGQVLKRIESYCFGNVIDATAWMILCELIYFDIIKIYEYNISTSLSENTEVSVSVSLLSDEEIVNKLKEYVTWVTNSETTSYSPWYAITLTIVKILKSAERVGIHDRLREMMEVSVHQKFTEFESKQRGVILIHHGDIELVYLDSQGLLSDECERIKVSCSQMNGSDDYLLVSKIICFANLKKAYTLYKIFDK